MNLHIDTFDNRFSDWTISNIEFKRGDTPQVNLWFFLGNDAISVSASEIRLGIKPSYGDETWVLQTDWTDNQTHWTGRPSFNGVTLETALSGKSSVSGWLEITWTTDGTNWESTNAVPVTILQDIVRGNEGIPSDSFATYPLPEQLLVTDDLGVNVAEIVNGKIKAENIPSIAITEFLGSVSDQVTMLALSGQKGDWCIRTDENKAYVVTGDDPSNVADWTALVYPPDAVTSVAGRTGAISLSSSDIADATSDISIEGEGGRILRGNGNGNIAVNTIIVSDIVTIGSEDGLDGRLQLVNSLGGYSLLNPPAGSVSYTATFPQGDGYVALTTQSDGSITTDDVTGITDYALDSSVVHLTGDQTISGTKSFDGNVGIGTTTPNEKLTVVGNISATGTENILSNQTALSSTSIMTRELVCQETLWDLGRTRQLTFVPTGTFNGSGGAAGATSTLNGGGLCSNLLGNVGNAWSRHGLTSFANINPTSGGTWNFSVPFEASIVGNAIIGASLSSACIRYYVANSSFTPTAAAPTQGWYGQFPYPANTRGFGVELRLNNGSLQANLYSRDGYSGVAGTPLSSGWITIDSSFDFLHKYHLILKHYGSSSVVDLWASTWVGGTSPVRPIFVTSLSGAGVPNDLRTVATNWTNLETMYLTDGVTPPGITNATNYVEAVVVKTG